MGIQPKTGRRVGYGLLGLLLALLLTTAEGYFADASLDALMGWRPAPVLAIESLRPDQITQIVPSQAAPNQDWPTEPFQTLLNQGRDQFARGQLQGAVESLTSALAQTEGDALKAAIAHSNLALVRGQLSRWSEAQQSIALSLELLEENASATGDLDQQRILAQTLNVQGRLWLARGEGEAALESWQQAAGIYQGVGDRRGEIRSRLRQASALQSLGFYRRAVNDILMPLEMELKAETASPLKAQSLRDLAEALAIARTLDEARAVAEESLAVAQALRLPDKMAAAQLTLGNIEYAEARELRAQNSQRTAQESATKAQRWYRLAAVDGSGSHDGLRAQLNHLALLIEFEGLEQAAQFWPQVYAQINTVPLDQAGIHSYLNLANSLEQLAAQDISGAPGWNQVFALLRAAEGAAVELQDLRAEAHTLGYLGKAYRMKGELDQDLAELQQAKQLTEEALFAAQAVNAKDISYLWAEQLGDLQSEFANRKGAIAAYQSAVDTLKSLRSDLVAINPEVQLSFQQSIEPLHRKLVSLLLEGEAPPNQTTLEAAQSVLESLRLEELNNYLRAACVNNQAVSIQKISADKRVAVLYPILLPDRLSIIATLPAAQTAATKTAAAAAPAPLKYYSVPLDPEALREDAQQMLQQLVFVDFDVLATSQRIYDQLFPADLLRDLDASLPDTLVFIPDGIIRNIPLAALFDGELYLVEKYSLAITPGLQLLNPAPLQERTLSALTFGLTEAVPGWSALPFVAEEVMAIGEKIPIQPFLNRDFTEETFRQVLQASSAPIVHLATHGKFSSQLEETYIQAWNEPTPENTDDVPDDASGEGRISVEELSEWLQGDRTEPVELLVLSACETASGDDRAALGLAGMAIRAGARSTIASLWQVDDAATAEFMDQFYQALSTENGNKAEALQAAQRHLIENFPGDFDHPYFWAPFVLIGNWL